MVHQRRYDTHIDNKDKNKIRKNFVIIIIIPENSIQRFTK